MSGFSPEWLALREPVDHASRDATVGQQLRHHFAGRTRVRVTDIGCGTGSNLRGTSHLLPDLQEWTLVDYDPRLLSAAREAISAWADTCEHDATAQSQHDGFVVRKNNKVITVRFRQCDLNADLEDALEPPPDLVTAAAFFDLCSAAFIERFVGAVAKRRAAFMTVLTYNGIQKWTPRHLADDAMLAAFCAHQRSDKGFGPSAGPDAASILGVAFRSAGYAVSEGDSPWLLGPENQKLVAELSDGFAGAVAETGAISGEAIASWVAVKRNAAVVGHTDTLALPIG